MAMQQTSRQASLAWVGSFESGSRANEILAAASEQFHLVSPASSVGSLPEGCEVATSFVRVDVESESYDVGMGKRGLSKVALDRIASAAGISWDPVASGRQDDGSDPYYCLFRAVGTMRGFDGVPVTITGTKEMDLRPSAAQVEALEQKARAKGKSADAQVREMRLHILGHAESKARLRAIRSIGIRTSYTPAELAKPFLIARLVFTGRTDDVELGRNFAMMRAQAMLGGAAQLYGQAPPPALAPANRMTVGVRPPPVGERREREIDEGDIPEPRRSPPPPPARSAAPAAPPSGGDDGNGRKTGFVVPFGRSKGDDLADVGDGDLAFLQGYYAKALGDPAKSRYREGNQDGLDAVNAEIAFREGGDREPGAD